MISICIATYNGENYIKEQIDSILYQIGDKDEIIISDDGSTDNTINIINQYKDDRIILLNNNNDYKSTTYPFYKISKNFENALTRASGDLIFLADQDDIWLEKKVLTVEKMMGSSLFLLHDCIIIDKLNNKLDSSYFINNKSKLGILNNIINCSFLGCCIIIRKELLKKALPFPQVPVPHDLWLGLIADWQKKTIMINDKLLLYRRHENNFSSSSQKSNSNLLYKIKYRFLVVYALIKRMIFNR